MPGIVDPDANTISVTIDSFSLFSLGFARAQEKDQQKCINALNKNLAKVAKAQGKSICDCIKDFAKGQDLAPAATLEICLGADRKGKVAKAQSKTESDEAKNCSGSAPDFGATDSANTNDVAFQVELDLIHDIFGSDLGNAILLEAEDKDTSKCQQQAAKAVKKCLDAKLKEFNKCKKNGLKDESIQTFADLQSCMGADPKGKIAKACDPVSGKIRSAIDKKCGSPVDTSTAFSGCGTADAATLAACLDQIVECNVCVLLNQADNLARDCDDFDDGTTNGSCP